jgi:hypothetical protein
MTGFRFGSGVEIGCRAGSRALAARGFEGLEGDLEGVDKLAGAAGVDGVGGDACDNGGEGDEDAGAVLDQGKFHAGDLGVDEDTAVVAVGVLNVVVVAVILAFERGRAATLAAGSLIVVALVVAIDVWNWFRHMYPLVSIWCMINQTNHLPESRICMIVKTKEMFCKI